MSITPLVVTFGGVDIAARLSSLGARFRVLYVEGAGLHGAEVTTERQPGLDGSRLVDTYLPERVVTVGFTMRSAVEVGSAASESQSDAERELNGIMAGRGLAQLELSHIVGWHFMAKAGGVRVSTRAAHYMEGELSFVCPSPFLRSSDPNAVEIPSSGVTYGPYRGNTFSHPRVEIRNLNMSVTSSPQVIGIGDFEVQVDKDLPEGHVFVLDWDRMRFFEQDANGARVATLVSAMSTFERPEMHQGVGYELTRSSGLVGTTVFPDERMV